jgi:hypothetical protein
MMFDSVAQEISQYRCQRYFGGNEWHGITVHRDRKARWQRLDFQQAVNHSPRFKRRQLTFGSSCLRICEEIVDDAFKAANTVTYTLEIPRNRGRLSTVKIFADPLDQIGNAPQRGLQIV